MRDPLSWLSRELPEWERLGLVDADQASRILTHVKFRHPPKNQSSFMLVLFGVLGTLLIGGGLILLLAYNWQDLSRPIRAVVSMLPLMVSQGMAAWVLHRRRTSTAWRESWALLWCLSISASIALIAQTYHMPGSFDSFLITWMLLSLPVMYVMQASTVLLVYFAGITVWAFTAMEDRGFAYEYWWLLAAALPHVIGWNRHAPFSGPATLSRWALMISVMFGLGGSLDFRSTFLWIGAYSCFAAILWLAGARYEAAAPSAWQRPGVILGGLGVAVIAYLLTWRPFWRGIVAMNRHEIQLDLFRGGHASVVIGMVLVWMIYAIFAARKRQYFALGWGALPAIFAVMAFLANQADWLIGVVWMMNLYLFAMGIWTLRQGLTEQRLGRINTGMLVICGLILTRFFDGDYSMLVRAVVFIAIGVAFLGVNLHISRNREKPA